MTFRSLVSFILAACMFGLTYCPAAEKNPSSNPLYFPLDAPAGTSRAVIVQGLPLVHTRQILPVDHLGKVVTAGKNLYRVSVVADYASSRNAYRKTLDSKAPVTPDLFDQKVVDQQIKQVLANLSAVLKQSGSGMNKLIRVNVYALSPAIVARFQEALAKQLDPKVRPVITSILSPLSQREAVVGADAVAVGADEGQSVKLHRCSDVAGVMDKNADQYADAAVLPAGGVAYLSGRPSEASLTESPVVSSVTILKNTLKQLNLTPADVVQLKVFMKPADSADVVLRELRKLFPKERMLPPVLFVEWLTPLPPTEIEMIARLPLNKTGLRGVSYYNPPLDIPVGTFSRVALVNTDRQIYISGLFSKSVMAKPQDEAADIFAQLQEILNATGSDSRHLAKAAYYVTSDIAGVAFDHVRVKFLVDEHRPPAASKVPIHGVGLAGRTMTFDMIAVEKDQ